MSKNRRDRAEYSPSAPVSQVGLAILQLLRPQLAKLHGGGPAELQQAFELLQDWQLGHNSEWLMQSAMEIQLHEAATR